MFDKAGDFSGHVTFVTGPGKDSGKTTFLNHAMYVMRMAKPPESCAVFSVGFDGEGRDSVSVSRKPMVSVFKGDVAVSTEAFLRKSDARFEILMTVPGVTALGRLAVARAGRQGAIVLVGPGGNDNAAAAVSIILDGGFSKTVFVDGAINRITQVSSFPGALFVYSIRVGKDNLEQSVRRMRLVRKLSSLSEAGTRKVPGRYDFEGALTNDTAALIPKDAAEVVVSDFTKVFLDEKELNALFPDSGNRRLAVRKAIAFAGFSVALKGVSRPEFMERLGGGGIAELVSFNPYETGAAGV